jgi:eukaryotic-like serine/threonine-protein kinase
MNPTPTREESLFQVAAALPAVDRAAFLDQECAANAPLRERLDALLAAHEQWDEALDDRDEANRPTVNVALPDLVDTVHGQTIGHYKLLEKIGEGGCGVVYVAEQTEPVRRRVALKIIKLGMDTREVIARFEAERQALALMDHPNIAKVLDAGTTETDSGSRGRESAQTSPRESRRRLTSAATIGGGRPFFVMELVRGIRITDYCERNQLRIRERLDLFIKVCQAIQHAHQKGIIHRDIKPSNILVTLHDGAPVPKVIDFGIAKATQGKLTDATVYTPLHQFIGTPAYMSPEQAEMSGLDIDTRSDIYSLGVLLYELLTGTTPFDAKELLASGIDAMRKIIREQEPVRPSTRLRQSTLAASPSSFPHANSSSQSQVANRKSQIDSDLDWIVMKCLEKDRARRYETANGLAADLQRHLHHEPVVARPPTAVYRFQRAFHRNRVIFVSSAAVALALILGLATATRQAMVARQAERMAQSEAAHSGQIARFLEEMLEAVEPSVALGHDTRLLRGILDRASDRLAGELPLEPEARESLRLTIGWTYFELGEFGKSEVMLTAALTGYQELFGDEHPEIARVLRALSALRMNQARFIEAESLMTEAVALQRTFLGEEHPQFASSLHNYAALLLELGRAKEAEACVREALALYRKRFGTENEDVADSLSGLAATLQAQGKVLEAESLMREALAMQRTLLANDHPSIALSLANLSAILLQERKLEEAEVTALEALALRTNLYGAEHPLVAHSLIGLAGVRQAQFRASEAESLLRQALAINQKILGNDHSSVALVLGNLAVLANDQGRAAEAERMFREALAVREHSFGKEHLRVADSLHGIASALHAQEQWPAAEEHCRAALEMRRRLLGHDHPDVAASLSGLAAILAVQGDLSQAEALLAESLEIFTKSFGEDSHRTIDGLTSLAAIHSRQGNVAAAEFMYRRLLMLSQDLFGEEAAETFEPRAQLAMLLVQQRRWNEIKELALPLTVSARNATSGESLSSADSLHCIGEALRDQGAPAEAEALFRAALAIRTQTLGVEDHHAAHLLVDIANVKLQLGDLDEADSLSREALARQHQLLGAEHVEVAYAMSIRGIVHLQRGQLEEAGAYMSEALTLQQRLLSPEHPQVLQSLNNLAALRLMEDRLADAERLTREALALARMNLGENHPRIAPMLSNLTKILNQQGRFAEAEALSCERLHALAGLAGTLTNASGISNAIDVLTRMLQRNPDDTGVFFVRGLLHGQQGRWAAATADLNTAAALFPELALLVLGPLYFETGDVDRFVSFRRETLARWVGVEDPETAAAAALVFSIQPWETGIGFASRMADLAVSHGVDPRQLAHFEFIKALAELRRGKLTEAVDWSTRSLARTEAGHATTVAAGAVLALARHKLNQPEAARTALAHAAKLAMTSLPNSDSGDLGPNWPRQLTAQILLREARSALESVESTARKNDTPDPRNHQEHHPRLAGQNL